MKRKSKWLLLLFLCLTFALALACTDTSELTLQISELETQISELESQIAQLSDSGQESQTLVYHLRFYDAGVEIFWALSDQSIHSGSRNANSDSMCAADVIIGFPLPDSCRRVNLQPAQ